MNRRWPVHGWLGLILVAFGWIANWSMTGMRTHILFFPLWLGYCLTVDALVVRQSGTSLLTRSRWKYAGLFLLSAPAWWLFEVINWRTQNWSYTGRDRFSDIEYMFWASLNFSTVIPAVFGSAELVGTFRWIEKLPRRWTLREGRGVEATLFALGWLMLALLLIWPRYFYPCVWLSLVFILEPVNVWLGNPSLLTFIRRGDWRPVASLALGCLICGFFWETWNIYSYPKWTYRIPFVGVCKIFEMPVLGYLGYIPFAWELLALYHLVTGSMRQTRSDEFLRIVQQRL